ncbi:hypothetical protein [Paenarthrobacter ureafaciens]|uniref:hypothetical protein n=1 Tax=Paenarthrobacter ureafaciens TaxID=37931 RepID=UPI001FB4E110|nr:hypothetical protein [Paenarthrobacter ureafaciens]UOD80320.1 hypothetical protein MQZ73_14525 [Paenarthrobacter ureafaciens]WNZ04330.1 hypothetical protein PVT25_01865 [Paenarthrobacter ureafaciens]
MTARDDSVAILHGSADNSLRWVWLSKKSGTITIARVDHTGFFFREFGAPGAADIAASLPRLWTYQLAGVSLAGHATHFLAPPSMQSIEPIPAADVVDPCKTEAVF